METITVATGADHGTRRIFSQSGGEGYPLKVQVLALLSKADENSTGPASFMVLDPDGNPILVDQHV